MSIIRILAVAHIPSPLDKIIISSHQINTEKSFPRITSSNAMTGW